VEEKGNHLSKSPLLKLGPSFEISISIHLQHGHYQLQDLKIQETVKKKDLSFATV